MHLNCSALISSLILIVTCLTLVTSESNDTVVRQTRFLSTLSFDEIIVDGAFDIFLSQVTNETSTPTVEIETAIDAQDHVIVEIVDNHILSIRIEGPVLVENNIYAFIRFRPPLRRYTIKGTGNILTDDNGITNEGTEPFVLDNQGVANVAMRLNVTRFQMNFTGTGNSRFWGRASEEAIFNAKGIGDINALSLLTKEVKVFSTGVSIVRVAATDDVQIEVTGVSNVYYRLPAGKKPSKSISKGLGKIVLLS